MAQESPRKFTQIEGAVVVRVLQATIQRSNQVEYHGVFKRLTEIEVKVTVGVRVM
jgi:hypothetical protein